MVRICEECGPRFVETQSTTPAEIAKIVRAMQGSMPEGWGGEIHSITLWYGRGLAECRIWLEPFMVHVDNHDGRPTHAARVEVRGEFQEVAKFFQEFGTELSNRMPLHQAERFDYYPGSFWAYFKDSQSTRFIKVGFNGEQMVQSISPPARPR